METLRHGYPTAVKPHRCNFCNEVIPKGEKYHYQTNVYDGDIYNWKSHLRCDKIASELKMYDDCDEGVNGEDFREYIKEAYYTLKPEDEKIPDWNTRLDLVCKHHLTPAQPDKT